MTMAGLLLAIAVLALLMGAIELLRREPFEHAKPLVAVLPSIMALVVGLFILIRRLSVRGEGIPFLVGFEAAGWPAVAAALMVELGFERQAFLYNRWAQAGLSSLWTEFIMWNGTFTQVHWDALKVGFDILALAAPPLLVALIGGWAAAYLGVTVVGGPALIGRPRSISVRRAAVAAFAAGVVLLAGVWAAQIRGRWLFYRTWADRAISAEDHWRQEYQRVLAQIRSLDETPGEMADDPARRAANRKSLLDLAEQYRHSMEGQAALRAIYEPPAQRPWLLVLPGTPRNEVR
jgi:hypothetical protein